MNREYRGQQQAINAEIKSLEESIRALRLRSNALAPVSSLPTEVVTAIFSLLREPATSSLTMGKRPDDLEWLRVAHVYHHWREIALNQPFFWSHIDFATLSSAGAAEMLARAKTVPLYLKARAPIGRYDVDRFSKKFGTFQKELQARVSHIRRLDIGVEDSRLHETFEGLVSPAPTLEYLSLSSTEFMNGGMSPRIYIPETLFDGTTPRLSCLELHNCNISWKSPLLKGLRYLEIRTPSTDMRPSLSVWLDALCEMPQLKTLTLISASPITPPGASFLSDVKRAITLPSLINLEISASARDCGLALVHLILPALTRLCLRATSSLEDGSDVQKIIPYVVRHAHGTHDTQPLQSMVVRSKGMCADIIAWTMPNIDAKIPNSDAFLDALLYARVAFFFNIEGWSTATQTEVFDAAMAALPLDGIVSLTSQSYTSPLVKQFWLRHVPRWSLLQRLGLGQSATDGFWDMLLEDNGGRESPVLPSLTKLVLADYALSARRTLHLCDVLMKRVEQEVPLEMLDLRTCLATGRAVELLSEIVVDVLGPEKDFETRAQFLAQWDDAGSGLFVEDYDSEAEEHDQDVSDTESDSDDNSGPWGIWGMDDDGDVYGEDVMDFW